MTECAFCGSPVTNLHAAQWHYGIRKGEDCEICDLCYGTTAGNTLHARFLSNENLHLLLCMMQIGNVILERLRK